MAAIFINVCIFYFSFGRGFKTPSMPILVFVPEIPTNCLKYEANWLCYWLLYLLVYLLVYLDLSWALP